MRLLVMELGRPLAPIGRSLVYSLRLILLKSQRPIIPETLEATITGREVTAVPDEFAKA